MLHINLDELETAQRILLQWLSDHYGHTLTLGPIDFYWSVEKEELYQPYQRPGQLTLGQLDDDWEETRKIAAGREDLVSFDLITLGALLAAVGNRLAEEEPTDTTPPPFQVDLPTLESALQQLFTALRASEADLVYLPDINLYWSVSPAEIYNPYLEPADLQLGLGQLADDWAALQRIAAGEAPPTREDLLALSAVLTAIGYHTTWIEREVS